MHTALTTAIYVIWAAVNFTRAKISITWGLRGDETDKRNFQSGFDLVKHGNGPFVYHEY